MNERGYLTAVVKRQENGITILLGLKDYEVGEVVVGKEVVLL